jgi:ATP-binding cassette subfamily E protein 1
MALSQQKICASVRRNLHLELAEEITEGETYQSYKYPTMMKTRSGFKLSVMKGSFNDSQIIVLLGENGTGKTTFIRMLV